MPMPLAPGPPGFTNIDPIRSAGRLARWRMTASSICLPFGLSQANGTGTLAHSKPLSGGSHAVQLIAALPIRGAGLAAATFGALRDTATRHRTTTAIVPKRRGPNARAARRPMTALPSTDYLGA